METYTIVNSFEKSFICGKNAGLADMRDVAVNVKNGWKIVEVKPANGGTGLEIHLQGTEKWLKTERSSDEW